MTVVTETANAECDAFPFDVLRRPSLVQVLRAQYAADVVLFGNFSYAWWLELLLCPRPWIATHHGWYDNPQKPDRWRDRLKVVLSRFASANVSVSDAVNRFHGNPGVVIPNPYEDATFHRMPEFSRDRDLLFLGRLVSDKGACLLLDALALLSRRGLHPRLTVIGSGPEEAALQEQAVRLELTDQVFFIGSKRGRELAELLNAHRIMVIPSRWNEPFGVVALEGIACGCVVVGSSGGGLPEAIGPCGVTFPNGDVEALAFQLEAVLSNDALCRELASHAPAHLAKHQKKQIAALYHDLLRQVVV